MRPSATGGDQTRALAAALEGWYGRAARPFPWRSEPSPYRTWVCEVMAQQTALVAVVPRFLAFVERLPDVRALAACPDEGLAALWAGLGYYARARNLRRGARHIVGARAGRFPIDAAGWREVPGCGPYTAAAVASICFGEPVAAVDGNGVRVAGRLLAIDDPALAVTGRGPIRELLQAAVERATRPGDFNQAVMELGQTICTRTSPGCAGCPVADRCAARRRGAVSRCPPPRIRPAVRPVAVTALVLRDLRGGVGLFERGEGLLTGTRGFPLAGAGYDPGPCAVRGIDGRFAHAITRHRIDGRAAEVRGPRAALVRLAAGLGAAGPVWVPPPEVAARLSTALDRKAWQLLVGAG
jgi:A/G-specific adenine glycosylase